MTSPKRMQSVGRGSVVITGCGWVMPLACGGIDEVLAAHGGGSTRRDEGYWPVAVELLAPFADLPRECQEDAAARLAAVALTIARRAAKVDATSLDSARVGLVLGVAQAGQSGMIDFADDVRKQSARFVSPIRFPQTVGNYVAGALARGFDIRGPNMTLASGLASGLDTLIEAHALLSSGRADVVYAGGSERLTAALAMGLAETGVLFSDGACLFVLERESDARRRGGAVLARVDLPPASVGADHATASVAGPNEPGVIWIEGAIGRCQGALGAAAVAAGIGAIRGLAVPVGDATGTGFTTRVVTPGPSGITVRAARRADIAAQLHVSSA